MQFVREYIKKKKNGEGQAVVCIESVLKGTPQNFSLAFIDEIENNYLLNFNAAFFFKNKEKHLEISLFYTCVPKILMI